MSIRKYIIWLIALLMIIFAGYVVWTGSSIGPFKVASYSEIEEKDRELEEKIKKLNDISVSEMTAKQEKLNEEFKRYEEVKTEYLNKLDAARQAGAEGGIVIENYDIEFIWATVGKYASKRNLSLTLKILKGNLSEDFENNKQFKPWDLSFEVTGNYGDITEFIYDLEKDDKIGARISDFKMSRNEEDKEKKNMGPIKSTFVVRGVPISTRGFNPDIKHDPKVDFTKNIFDGNTKEKEENKNIENNNQNQNQN